MKAPGWIITITISILTCAVLELNKNTLLGWLLFVLALIGMAEISRKYMGGLAAGTAERWSTPSA